MPVQEWSDGILVVDLADEPQFSEELSALADRLERGAAAHAVLNFAGVSRLNSSNISQLLRLRQRLVNVDRRLFLAALPDAVWSVMLVTGLDKVFHFTEDVPSALASLQMDG